MRVDLVRARWAVLLLAMTLLSTGCASLPLPAGRGMSLRYTPREAAVREPAEAPGIELPRAFSSPLSPLSEPEAPQRLHHHRASLGPGGVTGTARQSALAAHLAFLGAIADASGSTRRISGELSKLRASNLGIANGTTSVFVPYIDYGERQLRWIDAELAAATRLSNAASEMDDPDMQLALLRLPGPRLEAAMLGSLLLAGWLDFLNLVDIVLAQGFSSVEMLFVRLDQLQKMLAPAMTALSALEPGQVEAAAKDIPALMGHLSSEFNSTVESARLAMRRGEQAMLLAQLVDMVTMVSALKMPLPRLPPSTPITFGVGLVMGRDGVMMGTRMVVSTEWVEMMRRLVQAGVISLPAIGSAVRIHAGQVMMAQSHDELPRGVREALGDGPEVRGMRQTGRAGAGMAESPRHHVLPREFREWFEKRGFTGEMSIDRFCVRMEQADHEAIHGGGDWRRGRQWPGEWNQMLMKALREAEIDAGRMLTRNEILKIVAYRMRLYKLPMNFTLWRGQ
ncbi:DUF2380 domain-containing protein [Cystobacter fuscus]|uniref:DUF2380 domain-containing protein n=1 Tax=Cystobacter fuscus TaxID=43 RepID=UPI002B2F0670|nr:DUF2380 domain-containing protein [Cystobacter fuscus]